MAEETLARIYMKVNNKHGDFIPGVGARNITASEWALLPDHVKASVDASGFFRKPKAGKRASASQEAQDESESDVEETEASEDVEEPEAPVEGDEGDIEEGED